MNKSLEYIISEVTTLQKNRNFEEAFSKLKSLQKKFPKNKRIKYKLSIIYMENGNYLESIKYVNEILKIYPKKLSAHIQLINIHLRFANYCEALEIAELALINFPENQKILNKYFKALQKLNQNKRAEKELIILCKKFPENVFFKHQLSVLLRNLGNYKKSFFISNQIIKTNKVFWPAYFNKIAVLKDTQNFEELTKFAFKYKDKYEISKIPKMLDFAVICTIKLLQLDPIEAGKFDSLFEIIDKNIQLISSTQLIFLLEKISLFPDRKKSIFSKIIKTILSDHKKLGWEACTKLISFMHSDLCENWYENSKKIVNLCNPHEQGLVEMHILLLSQKHDEALENRKKLLPKYRTVSQIIFLSELLILRGSVIQAHRYLRYASRFFKSEFLIEFNRIRVSMQTDNINDVQYELKKLIQQSSNFSEVLSSKLVQLLVDCHLLKEADKLCLVKMKQFPTNTNLILLHLQIHLSLYGQPSHKVSIDSLLQKLTITGKYHSRLSRNGSLLNEIDILKSSNFSNRLSTKLSYSCPNLILDNLSKIESKEKYKIDIPKSIYQYWNHNSLPNQIELIVNSWRSINGFSHKIFNRKQAINFLKDNLGSEWANAFKLADSPTVESDFFRLCILMVNGGLYVDCDDRYLGRIKELMNLFSNLTFFIEPFGFAANNFIAAPPAHPLLAKMAISAKISLLSRSSDNPWQKTGPGLISRVIADHIIKTKENTSSTIKLLPRYLLYKYVQIHVPLPYKKTIKYWNKNVKASIGKNISSVLEE